MTLGRRLLALGSTRSGRWPTVWLADVSSDNRISCGVVATHASNHVVASACCVAVKLNDRGIRAQLVAL